MLRKLGGSWSWQWQERQFWLTEAGFSWCKCHTSAKDLQASKKLKIRADELLRVNHCLSAKTSQHNDSIKPSSVVAMEWLHVIEVHTIHKDNKCYYLKAESKRQMHEWLDALEQIISRTRVSPVRTYRLALINNRSAIAKPPEFIVRF